jgi:Uma2 family endonuclease
MVARKLISVEKYLRTSYSPDRDYVDGAARVRNWGDHNHASAHTNLLGLLSEREPQGGMALISLKLQIRPDRFRVADACLYLKEPDEQIPTTPPFLCVEVLSPQDRLMAMVDKVDDYLDMGVSFVWVVNPSRKTAWTITRTDGWRSAKDGILKTENPSIEVSLAEIFA